MVYTTPYTFAILGGGFTAWRWRFGVIYGGEGK